MEGEGPRKRQEWALSLRSRHKSKKPEFQRQESWRYKRVSHVWRKPDGTDSKMRKKVKGWPKSVEVGYRGPKIARNLHPSGYREVRIGTVDEVNEVNPDTQAIRIAHTVGMKKRGEIIARADEKGVHILNPPPPVAPEEEAAEKEVKETEVEEEQEEAEQKAEAPAEEEDMTKQEEADKS